MRNLKKLALASGASAILAVTALTGCDTMHHDSGDRTAGRMLDDKHISMNVQAKLKDEPVYKFSDVDVKTFAGVVQLSGFVSSNEQKSRAGELAQEVEGVQRVVNNITLKPNTTGLSATGRTNDLNQPNQSNQSDQ
ncbi:MAG TPA: BON domain-containing protein [Verrucomicrobiae bacterium]|jgi:osmotically-inducible protein OsmY|nr:BON domain-containing protein [Verrucomicrobiae bacterium]